MLIPHPNKIIDFAVNEEDTDYVSEIRIYNVRIPLDLILNEKTVKREIDKALATQRKEIVKEIEEYIPSGEQHWMYVEDLKAKLKIIKQRYAKQRRKRR